MAGKKGQKGGGGARKGAGQPKKPPNEYSRDVKAKYIQAAKKLQKEFGYGIEECILRLLYSDDIQDTVKVGIVKLYNDVLVIRETKQEINTNQNSAPAIRLPPRKADPAKIIPIKGGKKG